MTVEFGFLEALIKENEGCFLFMKNCGNFSQNSNEEVHLELFIPTGICGSTSRGGLP